MHFNKFKLDESRPSDLIPNSYFQMTRNIITVNSHQETCYRDPNPQININMQGSMCLRTQNKCMILTSYHKEDSHRRMLAMFRCLRGFSFSRLSKKMIQELGQLNVSDVENGNRGLVAVEFAENLTKKF